MALEEQAEADMATAKCAQARENGWKVAADCERGLTSNFDRSSRGKPVKGRQRSRPGERRFNTACSRIAAALAVLFPIFAAEALAQKAERVSRSTDGIQANDFSLNAAASADGAVVVFYSGASNLVPGDTNGQPDIFVHDRRTGLTERISVATGGRQANSRSMNPVVSADGNIVAFFSFASNLVSGDTNGLPDIFVHDRRTGITERVSVATGGGEANAASLSPAISADGNVVAFQSDATNLVPGDTNFALDVFVHDRRMGVTERVSVATGGIQANRFSQTPALNHDGSVVAFRSFADNLVAGDRNSVFDVFVRDRRTGVTERVSVGADGAEGNGGSFDPLLTADGTRVAFRSYAGNLVTGDTNGTWDVFVRDRRRNATERVSVGPNGVEAHGGSELGAFTADGRYVAFQSTAANLFPATAEGRSGIFIRDRVTGTTAPISVAGAGNGASQVRALSTDGNVVVFQSLASDLVKADSNGTWDIFVFDRKAGRKKSPGIALDEVFAGNDAPTLRSNADRPVRPD